MRDYPLIYTQWMFEHFTFEARSVVTAASYLARHTESTQIEPLHLFVGCFTDESYADILADVDRDYLIAVGARMLSWAPAPPNHLPFSPMSKRIFEMSLRETLALGDNHIDTGHLLIALLNADDTVVSFALGESLIGKMAPLVRERIQFQVDQPS